MSKVIMAIGAHIGDMELTVGGILATEALKGAKIVTVALTAGERGNPKGVTQEDYRKQKIAEAKAFVDTLGPDNEAIVLEYRDGELPNNEEVRVQVAELIRKYKPTVIYTHWKSTMHKDHNNTHLIVPDAQFFAGVDVGEKVRGDRHYAPVYFAENWEDADDYVPYIYNEVSIEGYQLWCEAIKKHWFIMNSSSFKYYDYYTHLARVRGCLINVMYAQTCTVYDRQKRIVNKQS